MNRFLFETSDYTILYTGDFRYELDAPETKLLYSFLQKKKIDRLYLDTTFCDGFYSHFPTREDSITQILELINKNKNKVVYLALDMLGTEQIILTISKTYKTKV